MYSQNNYNSDNEEVCHEIDYYRSIACSYSDSGKSLITVYNDIYESLVKPMYIDGFTETECVKLISDICRTQELPAIIKKQLTNAFLVLKMNSNCLFQEMHPYAVDMVSGKIKLDEKSIARYFKDNHLVYTNEMFRQYDSGRYALIDERDIREMLTNVIDFNLVSSTLITSVMEVIKDICYIPFSDGNGNPNFDSDPDIINCKNGLFDLKTGTLKSHTPDYLSIIQFPFCYIEDGNESCPLFDSFLNTALNGDAEQIRLIWQMMGYILASNQKAKKAFIIEGPTNTGKSTLVNAIIRCIVGENNISSVDWQDLDKDFMLSSLLGKPLNVADDLPTGCLKENGKFKAITGNGPVVIKIKYKPNLTTRLTTKFLFTCNQLPLNMSDRSSAFYDRLIIIEFNNQIAPGEIDRELVDKITMEKDAIFTKAVVSLLDLKESNYVFPEKAVNEAAKQTFRELSDPVTAFISDFFDIDDSCCYPCAAAYELFDLICCDSNTKPCSRHDFKQCLKSMGIDERRNGDDRLMTYTGLRLSEEKIDEYCSGREFTVEKSLRRYLSFNRVIHKETQLIDEPESDFDDDELPFQI